MTAVTLPGQLELATVGLSNDPKIMDIDLLKSRLLISSESHSGLIWKVSIGRAVSGNKAGSIGAGGYYRVTIEKSRYLAHRIIYALSHGADPGLIHVDHIDGDILNNHPSNLRLADRVGNNSNARKRKDNKTGVKGLFIRKRPDRKDAWQCVVKSKGVVHKKSFRMDKKSEAIEWIRCTRLKLHGEFHNHG